MDTSGLKAAPDPELHGVHETALYAEHLTAAEMFYTNILGLNKISSVPGRQFVFR